jgi:CelD/BcsL family acetyltransferase involved in cellulose biosynthesis
MPRPVDPAREAGAPGGVSIRWIPGSEGAAAQRTWLSLEARLGAARLACSWLWTGTWLEHYGDVVSHRFAVGEARGTACGIALVTRDARMRGPFPVRSVHLGTAGEPPGEGVYVEYNGVLVEPDHRLAFAAALVGEIARDPDWHELHLDGFAPEDAEPLLAAEPRLEARREICRTTDLRKADEAGGDVMRTLSSGTRKKLRRSFRDLGDVQTEWAETSEQALEIFEDLVSLHQARWNRVGQPGVFASPRFAAFHRALVPRLARAGSVLLFRARTASGTVGCEYGFIERGRALVYQSGTAWHPDNQVRLGFVTDALCMQACYERGLQEYDFLAGDTIYKRELSTAARELVWARWRRPAFRWLAMDQLAKVRRGVRSVRPAAGRRP